jgi:AcrR family transcriptional regulator
MKEKSILPWVETGYEMFSCYGPDALKIEQLARITGTSKSSFYHHFADIPLFREYLLQWHLERALLLAEKAKQCRSLIPEVVEMLIEAKQDIFFNRQLRIHRHVKIYQQCYEKAHTTVISQFIGLWQNWIGLENKPQLANHIFQITTDLFYQRITPANFTYEWLVSLVEEIKTIIHSIIQTGIAFDLDQNNKDLLIR